jgi:hypothetical protein
MLEFINEYMRLNLFIRTQKYKTFKSDEPTQTKNVANTSAIKLNHDFFGLDLYFLYSIREMRTLKEGNGRTRYLFTQ